MIPELRNRFIDNFQEKYNIHRSRFVEGNLEYSPQFFEDWRSKGFFSAFIGLNTFIKENSNINPMMHSFETLARSFLQSQGIEAFAPQVQLLAVANGTYTEIKDTSYYYASNDNNDKGWVVQGDGSGNNTLVYDPNLKNGMSHDQALNAAKKLELMETGKLW